MNEIDSKQAHRLILTRIRKQNLEGLNLHDKCKNCGCIFYECKHCIGNEFYRHVDDKIKMKENLKEIEKQLDNYKNTEF